MIKNFRDLSLPEPLQKALEKMNFQEPTPIQSTSIPLALDGKDILGTAQTGTGKTAAFCIPMITRLIQNSRSTSLILTPTRELAIQIHQTIKQLTENISIRSALLIGGDPIRKQIQHLRNSPRILVGTPGRIIDHLDRGSLMLHGVDFLVLDETDRMLEMGFEVQLKQIERFLTGKRQTLMFSATLPKNIQKIAESYLENPQTVSIGKKNVPAKDISQKTIPVNESNKYEILREELREREGSIIIFTKTKRGAEKLANRLAKEELSVTYLHGDLPQRKREKVIKAFRSKWHTILIATDVAARGLDVPHVEHVVNYNLPRNPEDYIHRIGRTARAGAKGEALNLIDDSDRSNWKAISRMLDPSLKKDSGSEKKPFRKSSSNRKNNRHFFKKRKSKKRAA